MTDVVDEKPTVVPADLAAIAAAQDAALDGAEALPGATGADAQAEQASNRPAELSAMVQMGVMVAAPMLPFLPECYTPQVCEQIGTALDAVATKYGWNLDNIMTPELALACVALPPTIQAVVMGRQYFAFKRAELAAQQAIGKAQASSVAAPDAGGVRDRRDGPELSVAP